MDSQANHLMDFLCGRKDLCVLEARKDAATFHRGLRLALETSEPYHTHVWHTPEGVELVLGRTFRHVFRYLDTLHNHVAWSSALGADTQRRKLGVMFGYDQADINSFCLAWSLEYCQCSKCVGVKKANPEVF